MAVLVSEDFDAGHARVADLRNIGEKRLDQCPMPFAVAWEELKRVAVWAREYASGNWR